MTDSIPSFQKYLIPEEPLFLKTTMIHAAEAGYVSQKGYGFIAIAQSAASCPLCIVKAPLNFSVKLLNGEVKEAFAQLANGIIDGLKSLILTVILTACLFISIFYPSIYTHIQPSVVIEADNSTPIASLKKQITALELRLQEQMRIVNEKPVPLPESDGKQATEAQKLNDELRNQVATLNKQLEINSQTVQSSKNELEKQVADLRKQLQEAVKHAKPTELDDKDSAKDQQIAQLQQQILDIQEKLRTREKISASKEQLEQELDAAQNDVRSKKEEILNLEERLSDVQIKVTTAQGLAQSKTQEIDKLAKKVFELETALSEKSDTEPNKLSNLEAENKNLHEKVKAAEAKVKQYLKELQEVADNISDNDQLAFNMSKVSEKTTSQDIAKRLKRYRTGGRIKNERTSSVSQSPLSPNSSPPKISTSPSLIPTRLNLDSSISASPNRSPQGSPQAQPRSLPDLSVVPMSLDRPKSDDFASPHQPPRHPGIRRGSGGASPNPPKHVTFADLPKSPSSEIQALMPVTPATNKTTSNANDETPRTTILKLTQNLASA